ncbi:MAG: glycosyltransferase family 9 protein [Acidobacteriota bacterium]|nr:glycosyltransferase family 9 protein [Acidobacteriota bacterium]
MDTREKSSIRAVTAVSSRDEIILVIRLGAMGDILHALPAVATLKLSFPNKKIVWLVARKWTALLEGNPYIDKLIPFDRADIASMMQLRRTLRGLHPEIAIDFQGLVQSAFLGRLARPQKFFGLDRSIAREPLASRFYTHRIQAWGPHRIQRNIQLAGAAGASKSIEESWIPAGSPEGCLPDKPFVLASPFAGWNSKQWPLEMYSRLERELARQGLALVINISPQHTERMRASNFHLHTSGLNGLIDATRRAKAVVGVDSGPLHLAAALKKSGVAIYGPTDPAQTGPFKSPLVVLRNEHARTTYKRGNEVDSSMASISPEQIAEALLKSLEMAAVRTAMVVRGS